MTATPKKAFYERGASLYPDDDAIAYSRALGSDSILLKNELASDRHIQAALDAGLRVWIYAGPGSWQHETWRATATSINAKLARFASHPRVMGPVVDQEDIDRNDDDTLRPREEKWLTGNFLAEHIALEAWMNDQAALGRSVGYTSYPGFLYWRRVAQNVPAAWGSPQLYGIISPGTPAEIKARGVAWKAAFRGGYVASLAAWDRTADEQADYLSYFRDVPGAIFWHTRMPEPGTRLFDILRAFRPGGGGGGGLVGLVALALVGYAGWRAVRR